MLTEVAEGVLVHESDCMQSNAIVVRGDAGVLLIDPGITRAEMATIAQDLDELDQPVVAGISTHPHWDHVLWDDGFGDVPRYGTARCAVALRDLLSTPGWEARVANVLPPEFADDIPLDLFGLVTGLPAGAAQVPWDGPTVRIVEHEAHAAGHAALVIEERGVLIAGDMLSDVLVPMLNSRAAEPIVDHLAALEMLEGIADHIDVVVPGHGSAGVPGQAQARLDQDRTYLLALRDGLDVDDPRIGSSAKPGWEWVRFAHEGQLASRSGGGN